MKNNSIFDAEFVDIKINEKTITSPNELVEAVLDLIVNASVQPDGVTDKDFRDDATDMAAMMFLQKATGFIEGILNDRMNQYLTFLERDYKITTLSTSNPNVRVFELKGREEMEELLKLRADADACGDDTVEWQGQRIPLEVVDEAIRVFRPVIDELDKDEMDDLDKAANFKAPATTQ